LIVRQLCGSREEAGWYLCTGLDVWGGPPALRRKSWLIHWPRATCADVCQDRSLSKKKFVCMLVWFLVEVVFVDVFRGSSPLFVHRERGRGGGEVVYRYGVHDHMAAFLLSPYVHGDTGGVGRGLVGSRNIDSRCLITLVRCLQDSPCVSGRRTPCVLNQSTAERRQAPTRRYPWWRLGPKQTNHRQSWRH